jgi:hypothetical protein
MEAVISNQSSVIGHEFLDGFREDVALSSFAWNFFADD